MAKANRKLLEAAIKYEILTGNHKKIHEVIDSELEYWTESAAWIFLEEEPSEKEMIRVLNHLGYDLKN